MGQLNFERGVKGGWGEEALGEATVRRARGGGERVPGKERKKRKKIEEEPYCWFENATPAEGEGEGITGREKRLLGAIKGKARKKKISQRKKSGKHSSRT